VPVEVGREVYRIVAYDSKGTASGKLEMLRRIWGSCQRCVIRYSLSRSSRTHFHYGGTMIMIKATYCGCLITA